MAVDDVKRRGRGCCGYDVEFAQQRLKAVQKGMLGVAF